MKNMKKKISLNNLFQILVLLVIGTSPAFAKVAVKAAPAVQQWKIKSSEIKFAVSHLTHNLEGVSKSAKGKAVCDAKSCEFLIGVPALSFSTDNGNRDQHMYEIISAAVNPIVTVRVVTSSDFPAQKAFNLDVSFAGKTHTYKSADGELIAKLGSPEQLVISGHFTIKLSDFSVKRPALLAIPVSDEGPIQVNLEFEAVR